MSDVFNSIREVSFRALLALSANSGKSATSDMIAAIDFITAYGKDFGLADENLHGDNNFKFSEFTVRRDTVNKALKKLVLGGFVTVSVRQTGFVYAVNGIGKDYCSKFESDYALIYKALAYKAWELVSNRSERAVMESINRHSIASIKGGAGNG